MSLADLEIDESKLPESATLDTGVMIRGLGQRRAEPNAPICRALWLAMEKLRNPIYVAAPSISEFHRSDDKPSDPKPAVEGVIVLTFDELAAKLLGFHMPHRIIRHISKESGEPRDYVKYDAIIVACVLRWSAGPLISLDSGQVSLAQSLGVEAYSPAHYLKRAKQTSLPFEQSSESARLAEIEDDQG